MNAATRDDGPFPLAGRRVLVTRAREAAGKLSSMLRARGACVEETALLRFDPPVDGAPLDAALERLGSYDMLLVTSANTVRVLTERRTPPWADQPWTAAVGPATAASLTAAGLRTDFIPDEATGEALLAALLPHAKGKRILLPRAQDALEVLPEGLRAAGAVVESVTAYRTVPSRDAQAELRQLFAPEASLIDFVTFTSGSTVDSFFLLLGRGLALAVLARSSACSIGPVTTARLAAQGVHRVHEAKVHTLGGLVAVLEEAALRTSVKE